MLTSVKCGARDVAPVFPIAIPTVCVGTEDDRTAALIDELDTLCSALDRALEMQNEAKAALSESVRLVTIVTCKITIAQAALADAMRRRQPLGAATRESRVAR